MAIFHMNVKVIGRSKGYSSLAAAAYRSTSKLRDEQTGRTYDFRNKPGLVHSAVMLTPDAPDEWADRELLWNEAERAEKRKDARLCREVEFALPHELSDAENIELARQIAQQLFVDRGMIADLSIHRGEPMPDGQGTKIHAHVLLTTRLVDRNGFGPKPPAWDARTMVTDWREGIAERINLALAAKGISARVDHRSFADRGIPLEPQPKRGPAALQALRASAGLPSRDQVVRELNYRTLSRDPHVALDVLTEHYSTFTRTDLARLVSRHTADREQFDRVMAKVMACPELVTLGQDKEGRDRFSTRAMVETERRMVEHAGVLAATRRHWVAPATRDRIKSGSNLGSEQKEALDHILGERGVSLLVGFAGTGKSRLLGAAREAWEAEGRTVRGAALAGIAAEALEGGSGISSRTIASLEYAWARDRDKLGRGDVLVIDEAGMVGSRQLERVLGVARKAGAKVVLVGDPEQLQAIEAGAAFRAIKDRHGAATLSHVRRQRSVWQQTATKEFATAQTGTALSRYGAAGMVHVSPTREIAMDQLVAQWNHDRLERPERTQLIMAYTRADVRILNELARDAMRASGHLQEDHVVATERGPRSFAAGDRVMFLRNDRDMGVKNGSLGRLVSIDGGTLRVAMDENGRQGAGRTIEIDLTRYAALDHGYASTIHKSQGVTVQRTKVLAGPAMDRHSTYVAMSRHTGRVDLHLGRDDFATDQQLVARLSRERTKDVTLDYREGEMAANRDELRRNPDYRRAEAEHRAGLEEARQRDINSERDYRTPEQVAREAQAQAREERLLAEEQRRERTGSRENEQIETSGRDGQRDTTVDRDRTNDVPLDDRTKAAVRRVAAQVRQQQQDKSQDRGRLGQAFVAIKDMVTNRGKSREKGGRDL